jgi:DNA modification methylase
VAKELERNGIGYELNPEIAKDAMRQIRKVPMTVFSTSKEKL